MRDNTIVNYLVLPVPVGSLERARLFYAGLLGLELHDRWLDRPGTLSFRPDGQRLDLAEGVHTGDTLRAALRVRRLGAVARRLADLGQIVTAVPGATPRLWVDDPFGNPLELVEAEAAQMRIPDRVTNFQFAV